MMFESDNSVDRRTLFRGALALSAGAFLAACGTGRSGPVDAGRLGVAAPPVTLPPVDAEPSPAVVLRTLQSIEHSLIDVLTAIDDAGGLPGEASGLTAVLIAEHERSSQELAVLIAANDGEPFECANPFVTSRAIEPTVAAYEGTDDIGRDVAQTAYAFENWGARASQAAIGLVDDPALRASIMKFCIEANRRVAGLALALDADLALAPTLTGDETPEGDGFPVLYAVDATFGQVTGIALVVGAADDEGSRRSVTLQTPAANSFVYDYMSC